MAIALREILQTCQSVIIRSCSNLLASHCFILIPNGNGTFQPFMLLLSSPDPRQHIVWTAARHLGPYVVLQPSFCSLSVDNLLLLAARRPYSIAAPARRPDLSQNKGDYPPIKRISRCWLVARIRAATRCSSPIVARTWYFKLRSSYSTSRPTSSSFAVSQPLNKYATAVTVSVNERKL